MRLNSAFLKGSIAGLALAASPFAVANLLTFYEVHNVSYREGSERVYEKADLFLAHTDITFDDSKGSVEVFRYSVFSPSKAYTDKNNDGKVDTLFIFPHLGRGAHETYLQRDKDYDGHPSEFQNADIDFRIQIKRFKPFIDRHRL